MTPARGVACLALALVAAAGCAGQAVPRLTPGPDVDALGLRDPASFRYTCGGFPFDAAILAEPGIGEQAATVEATALREYLATPPAKADGLPETGWHLIGRDDAFAEFIAISAQATEAVVFWATIEDGWRVATGPSCRPELVLPDGVGIATWTPDPDGPALGRQSRVVRLLVQEWACASGQGPIGRIVGPGIVPAADRLFVVFAVRPREGASTCQNVPPGRVEIDLGEAIGERVLVDPAFWPQVIVDVR